MTTQELHKALTTYANTDIRNARKSGEIMVCGLKLGLIKRLGLARTDTGNATLSYDGKAYSLTAFDFATAGSVVLGSGKPAAIRSLLVSLYKVEFA